MRFGYWMPVFGGWLRNVEDEGMTASWDYVRRLAQRSEQTGWDLTLIAELNLNDIKGVDQPALDRLDGSLCIHTPRRRYRQIPTTVTDDAVALPMRHLVSHAIVTPSGWSHAPHRKGLAVLQQEPFGRGVGHGIIRPRGELVQAAVHRPGVAATGFRNLGAKSRVGQHIDPGPRGA